ncbi:MAG: MFS transporter, partial [Gaiellaceae bacterium]
MLRSLRERLAESRQAFSAVFTNPGLRRLELSWTGTVCAYWIFIVTLSLFAYEHGGAGAVGLVGLLRVLPSVVASPFGAVLGDRYPRERVMVAINLLRSLTIAGAAVAAFAGAPAGIVYALGSLMGLLQSTFRPTQAALLPQLARTPEELTAANLVLTTIEGMGIFLGPAIGGLLLAATGTDVVFAATAGVFLVSAFLLVGVRVERGTPAARVPAGFLREAFAGYRTVARDARLRLVIGLYGAQTLVAGALNVLIVVAALELLDLGKAGIGYLNSAVGVGGLVGGFGALALLGRTKLASDFGVGLVLLGLPIALIGVFPETAVALVLLGLVGVGTTIVDVAGVTLLQRAVPDDVLTRVMGVVQSVFVGTLGIGAVIAPLLTSTLHVRGALIATGAALPVLTVLAWTRLRALDAQTAAPARGLELLHGISLFRPLPPATMEQLAANLIPVHAAAGEEIVRQGAIGDRFYIVARGELDVTVDGRRGEPLRAGDHFGEIALLHDVPRTATVRARTDVELLALDRDEFLGAVTGHPESAEAAHAVVAARLAS